MVCDLCIKNEEEYNAFYNGKIIRVCDECVKSENLTVIRKPTREQLEIADRRFSVHERMMKLSGLDQSSKVGKDHRVFQENIAKIKIPPKKQNSDLLVYNYNWNIMMARRRRKMTLNQLADLTKISILDLQNFERGVLPKDFEKIAKILSNVLNIVLLKSDIKKREEVVEKTINKDIDPDEEIRNKLFKEDLEINKKNEEFRIKEKAEEVVEEVDKEIEMERTDLMNKINEGKLDFSKREKLKNVTLSDLVEIKRKREKLKKAKERIEEKQEIVGKDIEILDE